MCSIQNRQTKKNNDSNNDDCKCIPLHRHISRPSAQWPPPSRRNSGALSYSIKHWGVTTVAAAAKARDWWSRLALVWFSMVIGRARRYGFIQANREKKNHVYIEYMNRGIDTRKKSET